MTLTIQNLKHSVGKLLRCLDLYPWYPMTQALHKILIHDYAVIELFILPLGMFSEEAQEATNKVFKISRENFRYITKKNVYRLVSLNYCKSQRQISLYF